MLIPPEVTCGPFGDLLFAVRYGSGRHDIDILAVFEPPPLMTNVMLGGLDCLALGVRRLNHLLNHLDPAATEPLLTGELVAGTPAKLEEAKAVMASAERSPFVSAYLFHAACVSFQSAAGTLARVEETPCEPHFRLFSKNLSWAASYLGFAHYYHVSGGCGPITLACLLPQLPPVVETLWTLAQTDRRDYSECRDALSTFALQLISGLEP